MKYDVIRKSDGLLLCRRFCRAASPEEVVKWHSERAGIDPDSIEIVVSEDQSVSDELARFDVEWFAHTTPFATGYRNYRAA